MIGIIVSNGVFEYRSCILYPEITFLPYSRVFDHSNIPEYD
jgi:hypothetical protein